jgi:hypothetical protein
MLLPHLCNIERSQVIPFPPDIRLSYFFFLSYIEGKAEPVLSGRNCSEIILSMLTRHNQVLYKLQEPPNPDEQPIKTISKCRQNSLPQLFPTLERLDLEQLWKVHEMGERQVLGNGWNFPDIL